MRRSETIRLDTSAEAEAEESWHSDESGDMPGSPGSRLPTKGRWRKRVALALAMLLLAVLVASGSLALSTYVFAAHQPAHARQAGKAVGTSTATTQPTPTATATALPVSRITSIASSQPPCVPGGSHPLGVISGTGAQSEVALTFDDGPTPYSTPAILNVLEQTHTPATFFVLGQYVTTWPNLLQREASDGFAIGIHTWSHPDMTTLSPSQQFWQLSATQQAIRNVLGASSCPWFWRPPYGSYNQQVLQTAAQLHLTTITWDDDPADWSRPGASVIVQRVLSQVHAGSIVLMHDGPALREQTADALPAILAGLKARGLRPVTIPQLLADGGYSQAAIPSAATTTPADGILPASLLVRDAAHQPPQVLASYRSILAPRIPLSGQPSFVPDILVQPSREPRGDIREAGVGDGMRHVVLAVREGDGQRRERVAAGAAMRDG